MLKALTRVFGSRNERLVKSYGRAVRASAALEERISALSDEEMRAKTFEFRNRLAGGTPLEALQPEAFALVREAAQRVLKMRHFDVQLIGGLALHEGILAQGIPAARLDPALQTLAERGLVVLRAGGAIDVPPRSPPSPSTPCFWSVGRARPGPPPTVSHASTTRHGWATTTRAAPSRSSSTSSTSGRPPTRPWPWPRTRCAASGA